ncbi:MAG: phospho-sugar mutase [Polyangiales bacterium]
MAETNRDQLIQTTRRWIADDPDESTQRELQKLLDDGAWDELAERFSGPLEFGTAGLRGIVGAGLARMNRAVVIRTTAGLAHYLKLAVPDATKRGVVLGRDARRGSAEFLADAAAVLAAEGIPAHVFEGAATPLGCVPTPLVSYATRVLGAAAGVMITASHNPPEYNGYKVYAANSAQIIPPTDEGIARSIHHAKSAREIPRMEESEARAKGLRHTIERSLVDGYFEAIVAASRRTEGRAELVAVYTPMHGVGDAFAREVFAKMGIGRVVSVPEQAQPDAAFPTVRFPNPEEPGAMDLSLALAKKEHADIVIANDPDADRLAVAVPDGAGNYVALTGNEIGVLLGHYLLADDPNPTKAPLAITTIVSSPQLGVMCAKLGVRYAETLTGFKWITNKAMELEQATGAKFVFGYEEALGYTADTLVRDKDGISAAARFLELAASLKARGDTVLHRLETIHRTFGLVVSKQRNVTHKGSEGAAEMKAKMAALRKHPPHDLGGEAVVAIRDYLESHRRSVGDGAVTPIDLPKSDVLAFELEGGTRVTVRPSGTEPKIKYYFDVVETLSLSEPLASGRKRAEERLARLESALLG